MPRQLLLQDACVLVNLVASGRFEDIARDSDWQFMVVPAVCAQAHHTLDATTGEIMPIDLLPYLEAGLLEKVDVETEEEQLAYIAYAAQRLDDGEAMSLALAQTRHLALATDDRRARLLINQERVPIKVYSTIGVLRRWETRCRVPAEEIRQVLESIKNGACPGHNVTASEHAWWIKRLGDRTQRLRRG